MPYFDLDYLEGEDPRQQHLVVFVESLKSLLKDVITNERSERWTPIDMGLFESVRGFALESLPAIERDLDAVINALRDLPEGHEGIVAHGLVGPPQRFKLEALSAIELTREYFRSAREWLRRLLAGADVIFESICAALGLPAGGLAREAKQFIEAML